MNAHLCSYGETSVKHIPRVCTNATGLIMSELRVGSVYDISHPINTATPCRSRGKGVGVGAGRGWGEHRLLNFNNVSHLSDWKWNYLVPAVFHSTPLLYFCKAIYPLLLSNRATYPGSHLQTAGKKLKTPRWISGDKAPQFVGVQLFKYAYNVPSTVWSLPFR